MKYNIKHELTVDGKAVLGANYPEQSEAEGRRVIYGLLRNYDYSKPIVFELRPGLQQFEDGNKVHTFTITEDKSNGTVPLNSRLKQIENEVLAALRSAFKGLEDSNFDYTLTTTRSTTPACTATHPVLHSQILVKQTGVHFSITAREDA